MQVILILLQSGLAGRDTGWGSRFFRAASSTQSSSALPRRSHAGCSRQVNTSATAHWSHPTGVIHPTSTWVIHPAGYNMLSLGHPQAWCILLVWIHDDSDEADRATPGQSLTSGEVHCIGLPNRPNSPAYPSPAPPRPSWRAGLENSNFQLNKSISNSVAVSAL